MLSVIGQTSLLQRVNDAPEPALTGTGGIELSFGTSVQGYRGLIAKMSTPLVPNSAALEADGASENVSYRWDENVIGSNPADWMSS